MILSAAVAMAQVPALPRETGTVQGMVVRTTTGEAISGAQVRLVDPATLRTLQQLPAVGLVPPAPLRHNRARYQTAVSDTAGRFVLTNVIPGEYKLFAWPDAPGGSYFSARFLSRYEEQGRSVSVSQGGSASVDLLLAP